MIHTYSEPKTNGRLRFLYEEASIGQQAFAGKQPLFYSILWNLGPDQAIIIDEKSYTFPAHCMLALMMNQSFLLEEPKDVWGVQFNTEFYCIVNHDAEVGCVGYLFYGLDPVLFIDIPQEEIMALDRIATLFREEFASDDDHKEEMLRTLLVRLILKTTRLAKASHIHTSIDEEKFNLLRQFNLQVEIHFRQQKQVQFYAGLLNKSPKTLSNTFALYSTKTPLQIIHERIITEAKRLIYYTDKPIKQIAGELGFEDVSHFSKFFKNHTQKTPMEIKSLGQDAAV